MRDKLDEKFETITLRLPFDHPRLFCCRHLVPALRQYNKVCVELNHTKGHEWSSHHLAEAFGNLQHFGVDVTDLESRLILACEHEDVEIECWQYIKCPEKYLTQSVVEEKEYTFTLADAFNLAVKHHKNLYDGLPYRVHLAAVVEILQQWQAHNSLITNYVLCLGALHDIIEDTDISEKTLALKFGPQMVTDIKMLSKLHLVGNEPYTYEKYIENVKTKEHVRLVKLADTTANLNHSLRKGNTRRSARRIEKYAKQLILLNEGF